MTSDAEKTYRIGEAALEELKNAGLAATAYNYELWYAHLEGKNPALSRALERALKATGKLSQETAQRLFSTHIQHADKSRSVLDLVARIREETADLQHALQEGGTSAANHSRALSELSGQLTHSVEGNPAAARLAESIVGVAADLCEHNRRLEARLEEAAAEIGALQENALSIQSDAMTDKLTGVANRDGFDRMLEESFASAERDGVPLCILMADIDNFNQFNERWGHQTGDQVLKLVAQVMLSCIRNEDKLARFGGEEFAVIMSNASAALAASIAEQIRGAVESRRLKKRRTNEDLGVITLSMGVSARRREDTAEQLLERADEQLAAAKRAGRNRVACEDAAPADGASDGRGGVGQKNALTA